MQRRLVVLILLALTPCLVSGAEPSDVSSARELPGETRRDCARLELAKSSQSNAVREACIIWIEGSGGEINAIETTDAAGQTAELARREPVYPWADIYLTPPRGDSQWLITAYKSETDRPRGDTFFVEVYSLATRRKVLEAQGADVALTDLNDDGTYELVVHEALALTEYDVQIGWPHVYVLSDAVELQPLQEYPELIRDLVARLENSRERLGFICRDGPAPCAYAPDIELLSAQVAIARAMLPQD